MAQNAVKLLYSLASYFAGHAALRANGCLEVLVTAMASSDVTCAQFAVWAIQSLTGGLFHVVPFDQQLSGLHVLSAPHGDRMSIAQCAS